ncbi:hypothetical protein [Salmonirosea aquatica]|uniref:Uncharacterized protein n=1 Tax=Salmonirosea aquatica TaxID=2654236 RepID=A0A7C9F5T6_9BACT|nr:hypothetical protein [Cytophagaceae bacterium SJW1-29]
MKFFLLSCLSFLSTIAYGQNITIKDLISITECDRGTCFGTFFEGRGFHLKERDTYKGLELTYCTDPSIDLHATALNLYGGTVGVIILKPDKTAIMLLHDRFGFQENLLAELHSLGFTWTKRVPFVDDEQAEQYNSSEFSDISILVCSVVQPYRTSRVTNYVVGVIRERSI